MLTSVCGLASFPQACLGSNAKEKKSMLLCQGRPLFISKAQVLMAIVGKKWALRPEPKDLERVPPPGPRSFGSSCVYSGPSPSQFPHKGLCVRGLPSCHWWGPWGSLWAFVFVDRKNQLMSHSPQSSVSKSRKDGLGDSSADLAASGLISENHDNPGVTRQNLHRMSSPPGQSHTFFFFFLMVLES